MTISLIGIIVVQSLWIKHAYEAESGRFDQAVYKALNRGISKLERVESFRFLDHELNLPKPPKMNIDSLIQTARPRKPHMRFKQFDDSTRLQRPSVVYLSDTNMKKHVITIIKDTEPAEDVEVIWNADSIEMNMDFNMDKWIDHEADVKEMEELVIATEEEIQQQREKLLKEKYNRFNETMNQWVIEYSFDDETFNRRVLRMNIDTILSKALQNNGIPVSIFIDPEPEQIKLAHQAGANMIEIHTGVFCEATDNAKRRQAFAKIVDAAKLANKLKLGVKAGHGLCYKTIKAFKGLTEIDEYNIGHSIVSRAALVGMDRAVREMRDLIRSL